MVRTAAYLRFLSQVGTVNEFYGLTELVDVSVIAVIGHGHVVEALPATTGTIGERREQHGRSIPPPSALTGILLGQWRACEQD